MAFRKLTTLPNSASGTYIRLSAYRWDRVTREASAHFHLYASPTAAQATPGSPLCLIAVLRLSGAKFDEYMSPGALDAPGGSALKQLYAAARSEPLIAGGELTQVDFADAADV